MKLTEYVIKLLMIILSYGFRKFPEGLNIRIYLDRKIVSLGGVSKKCLDELIS